VQPLVPATAHCARFLHVLSRDGASAPSFAARMPPAFGSAVQRRSMFIQTQPTPNPSSLKFLPGCPVLDEESGHSSMDIPPGSEAAQRSGLARKLLALDGCVRVFFAHDFISVTKDDASDWEEMKPHVFATIMDFFASGEPVVSDMAVADANAITDDDNEIVALIKELLETRIRPSVQEDGGDILFQGFDEDSGLVYLQLAGSCAGCPSSSVTLKSGVENMLMHYIPEVEGVVQVEDEDTTMEQPRAMSWKTMD
jgi:Fe-S cluster biogenesis protein NfuA